MSILTYLALKALHSAQTFALLEGTGFEFVALDHVFERGYEVLPQISQNLGVRAEILDHFVVVGPHRQCRGSFHYDLAEICVAATPVWCPKEYDSMSRVDDGSQVPRYFVGSGFGQIQCLRKSLVSQDP